VKTVRIESDGDSVNTRVVDVETGHTLPVTSIGFSVEAGHPAVARIETVLPEIDVSVLAEVIGRCPHCGHVEDVS
jgi:hypothetical protein